MASSSASAASPADQVKATTDPDARRDRVARLFAKGYQRLNQSTLSVDDCKKLHFDTLEGNLYLEHDVLKNLDAEVNYGWIEWEVDRQMWCREEVGKRDMVFRTVFPEPPYLTAEPPQHQEEPVQEELVELVAERPVERPVEPVKPEPIPHRHEEEPVLPKEYVVEQPVEQPVKPSQHHKEEPVQEEHVVEQPVVEQPVVEQPVVEQPVEQPVEQLVAQPKQPVEQPEQDVEQPELSLRRSDRCRKRSLYYGEEPEEELMEPMEALPPRKKVRIRIRKSAPKATVARAPVVSGANVEDSFQKVLRATTKRQLEDELERLAEGPLSKLNSTTFLSVMANNSENQFRGLRDLTPAGFEALVTQKRAEIREYLAKIPADTSAAKQQTHALYRLVLRAMRCDPSAFLNAELGMTQGVSDSTIDPEDPENGLRLWTQHYCVQLRPLVVHPFWLGSPQSLGLGIRLAVIARTGQRYKLPRGFFTDSSTPFVQALAQAYEDSPYPQDLRSAYNKASQDLTILDAGKATNRDWAGLINFLLTDSTKHPDLRVEPNQLPYRPYHYHVDTCDLIRLREALESCCPLPENTTAKDFLDSVKKANGYQYYELLGNIDGLSYTDTAIVESICHMELQAYSRQQWYLDHAYGEMEDEKSMD